MGDTETVEMSQIIPEDSIPFVPTTTTSTTTETATPVTPILQPETETNISELIVPTTTSMRTFSSVHDSGLRYPRRKRKPFE
jgi:hypothetical protein